MKNSKSQTIKWAPNIQQKRLRKKGQRQIFTKYASRELKIPILVVEIIEDELELVPLNNL